MSQSIFRVGGTGVPPVRTAETAVPPEITRVTLHYIDNARLNFEDALL